MERLFGSARLSVVDKEVATEKQVLVILNTLSRMNNLSELELESIFNQFCLLRSANICGDSPKCNKCKLKNFYNYDK